jgi:hypothetical protein
MRIAVCVIAMAIFVLPAAADSVAVAIENFGLIGSWATDCTTELTTAQSGFRAIFSDPSGGAPVYTTTSVDEGVKTTVRSTIQAAVLHSPHKLKLMLKIIGGDRDGFPLPSPTTNTFEQIFEILDGRLQIGGATPISLQRCRN